MTDEFIQNEAYRIAVIYGRDAETTTVNLKLMTFDRAKPVVGHEFTTPSDQLDLFIDQVRQTIAGVGVREDLGHGLFLSIQRKDDWIIFDAPVHAARTLAIPMTVADATTMADDLDAVQDSINMLLGAGVILLEAA